MIMLTIMFFVGLDNKDDNKDGKGDRIDKDVYVG
jgi:hypothetical protein